MDIKRSPVQPWTMDRTKNIAPTSNGKLCPYLDYKMVVIGFGVDPEMEDDTCSDKVKMFIKEEIAGPVKPNAAEEEFFRATFSYQRELPIDTDLVDHPDTALIYEELKAVIAQAGTGCDIDDERREEKNKQFREGVEPKKEAEMYFYMERFPLCRACEKESATGEPVACDYRDFISFGDKREDVFPVCRRYEYYADTPTDAPVDTHQRKLDFIDGASMGWIDKTRDVSGAFKELSFDELQDLFDEEEE